MSCEAGCACVAFRSALFGKDKCRVCAHLRSSHIEFKSDSSVERELVRTDSGPKIDESDAVKKDPVMTPRSPRQKVHKNPHKRGQSLSKPVFNSHRRAISEPAISLLDGEITTKGCQVSGYLEKVASHTFAGKEVWQRRWFVLNKDEGTLQYWHAPSDLLEDSKMTIWMDRVVATELDESDKKKRSLKLIFSDKKAQPFYVRAKTAGACTHWKREFDTTARAALSGLTEEETGDIEIQHFENTAFSILSSAQQRTLSALFKLVQHKQHNPIFSPDDDGPHFALILSGKVALIREGAEEDTTTHRTLKEGDYLSRSTYDATIQRRIATAKSVVWETHCWQLSTENYQKYLTLEKDENVKRLVSMLIGEDYSFLGKIDVLSCMPPADHHFLAAFFRYQFLGAGETLFEEGSVGTALYIVLTGCVQACGQGSVMHKFREHEFFGEVGLLMAIPRTASMVAGEDSVIIRLDKSDFTQATAMLTPEASEALNSLARLRLAEQFTKYDVPLFQMIPQSKYQELADICHMQDFPRNAVIFREDEPGHTFFLLVHGRCAVSVKKKLADGSFVDEKIAEKKPGEYFGEIAMIVETTRTATVSCMERSVVLSITAEDFAKFFREAPEALADFELKLARHEVRLCSILYHPIGTEYLSQFLRAEYSSENLEFWKACLAFTRMPEHATIAKRKAEELYASRVSASVNRSPRTPKQVHRSMAESRPSEVYSTPRPSANIESLPSSATDSRPSLLPSSPALGNDPSPLSAIDPLPTVDSRLSTPEPRSSVLSSPEKRIPPPPPPSTPALSSTSTSSTNSTQETATSINITPTQDNSADCKIDPSLSQTNGADRKNETPNATRENGEIRSPPPPPPISPSATKKSQSLATPSKHESSFLGPHKKTDSVDEDRVSLLIELPPPPPPPEERKKILSPEEIRIHERCQAIYDEFLDPQGIHQVNLSLSMREAVQNALLEKRVDIDTLAQCFSEVENLVQTDSFSRFKKSPLFEELLEQVQSYDSKSHIRGRMRPTKSATARNPEAAETPKAQQPGTHRRMRSLTTKATSFLDK